MTLRLLRLLSYVATAAFLVCGVSAEVPGGADKQVAPPFGEDSLARIQIYLDQQGFGPGAIDGKDGEFLHKAMKHLGASRGIPEADWSAKFQLPVETPATTPYQIRDEDLKQVGKVPSGLAAQAEEKYLPYPSVLNFVAERFHTDPRYLRQINKDKDWDHLKPGDSVTVPHVQAFKIEDLGIKATLPANPEHKDRTLKVHTQERMLDVMEGDHIVASFPVSPGSEHLPAPKGVWKILSITTLPIFRWDKEMLQHGKRSADFHLIPPGPSNPVGVVWIELNRPGIGLHGTNEPETIGRASSHGCIRLANWDAAKLSGMVTAGVAVVID